MCEKRELKACPVFSTLLLPFTYYSFAIIVCLLYFTPPFHLLFFCYHCLPALFYSSLSLIILLLSLSACSTLLLPFTYYSFAIIVCLLYFTPPFHLLFFCYHCLPALFYSSLSLIILLLSLSACSILLLPFTYYSFAIIVCLLYFTPPFHLLFFCYHCLPALFYSSLSLIIFFL